MRSKLLALLVLAHCSCTDRAPTPNVVSMPNVAPAPTSQVGPGKLPEAKVEATATSGATCEDAASRAELDCVPRLEPGGAPPLGMTAAPMSCAPGLTLCGAACVDLSSDASHCGGCGVQCGAGACSAGKCPAGKLCATEWTVETPLITDFESYGNGTPPEMWSFSFNAPPGQPLTVYAGPYQFSDGTGAQTLRMVAGNASNYAVGISNSSASVWGGGLGFWMGCIDASSFDGIAFDVRGDVLGGQASVSLSMQQTSAPDANDADAGGTCLSGCQAPLRPFAVGAGWSRVLLPWSAFTPGSANQTAVPATGRDITGLSFSLALDWAELAGAPGTYGPRATGYELAIDNIGFFRSGELCAAGQQICDSRCVDLQRSNEHCGSCGNACSGGAQCAGAAGCACPSGLSYCAGQCVNLGSDASHCGSCANFCPIGASCNQGTCSGGAGNTSQRCGQTTRRIGNPLGCDFAWGANPDGAIPAYLGFASKWVGYEPNPTVRCDGCDWLAGYGNLDVVPTYIAYFTAYHANLDAGLGDCNLDANGNLCTGGAQYIRDNRARLIAMYAAYAQRSYAAYPSRPVIWVIEPDASQYAEGQSGSPLSMSELGSYISDIICAIKTNMPNAVIALNHSTWLSGDRVRDFWSAMPLDRIDLLHITSAADVPGGYFNATDANNREEGTFRYLSQLTGRPILADTSFGITTMQDSWSSATVATLDARIADGVVGALIYPEPGNYAQRIAALAPQLESTCR